MKTLKFLGELIDLVFLETVKFIFSPYILIVITGILLYLSNI